MSENDGDPILCPSHLVDVNSIYSDRCENWFHFECETLTAEDARKHNHSEDSYYSLSCIYEGQCEVA